MAEAYEFVVETSTLVETAGPDLRPVWVHTLPGPLMVEGHDLSGATICLHEVWPDPDRSGLSHARLAAAPVVVRRDGAGRGPASVEVDAGTLVQALETVRKRRRLQALLAQARALADRQGPDAALSQLREALADDDPLWVGEPVRPAPAGADTQVLAAARLERAGILAAYANIGAPDALHDPTATVDDRFTHVAYAPDRCVERTCFLDLLARARMAPGDVVTADQRTIAGMARCLADARTTADGRTLALVAGAPYDLTHDLHTLCGVRGDRQGAGPEPRGDVVEGRFATLHVDRAQLLAELGLTNTEVDAVVCWLECRLASDLAAVTARLDASRLSCLLRSPAVVRMALEDGSSLVHARSGERLVASPHVTPDALNHLAARVACDDAWEFSDADARRVAHDPTARVRLLDAWAHDATLGRELALTPKALGRRARRALGRQPGAKGDDPYTLSSELGQTGRTGRR